MLQVLLVVPLELTLVFSLHLHLGCWWALSWWESVSHASDVPFSHCEAESGFLLCRWCLHVAIAQLVLCWLPLALRHFLLELLLVLQVLLGLEPLRSGLMPLALQLPHYLVELLVLLQLRELLLGFEPLQEAHGLLLVELMAQPS